MGISITSLAYVLPGQKNTNAELAERFGSETVAKIESISGILERRTAKGDTCASDLSVRAARLIFENSKISPKDIDLLIFATQTPDYLIPTTACIIQQRLGIDNSCAAFDINLGCSQFVYALATARAWICGGLAKNALVLCADTPTKIIDPLDRSTACIFGDGGAACTVSKSEIDGILGFSFGTDGKGFDSIIWPNSGLRGYGGETMRADKMAMDGFKIFTFAYKRVAESVAEVLEKNGMSVRDIYQLVFHQSREKKVKYIDLNVGNELKIDWSKDTCDKGDHLNYSGAMKVTEYLGEYLSGNYELPDHRKDKAYDAWGQALKAYSSAVKGV